MVTGDLHVPLQGCGGTSNWAGDGFRDLVSYIFLKKVGKKRSSYDLEDAQLKINMQPKNAGLEDYFPLQMGDFHVPC